MKERVRAHCPFIGGLIGHSAMTILSDMEMNQLVIYTVGLAIGIIMWKGLAYSLSEEDRA